jgi:D-alanine transaminase
MSRIAYVNGRYVPHSRASVHIEDRGYQFADGVYEVMAVAGGAMVEEEAHLDRLDRSLDALRIPAPMARTALRHVLREVIRRNRLDRGIVYLQVTRGVARRDHAFPDSARPSLVVTARGPKRPAPRQVEDGVKVITIPDIRWRRCDIKSVALLANVLGKQQAKEAGAFEAWMVDDAGNVTEGTASNAWIVTAAGELVTRNLDQRILAGVTRGVVGHVAGELGLSLRERSFSVAEAKAAVEAFVTGTTAMVMPVVRIDDASIGAGRPGPVAQRLRAAYENAISERR